MNTKLLFIISVGVFKLVHGATVISDKINQNPSGSCNQRIFVATGSPDANIFVVSEDGGETWTDRSPAPCTYPYSAIYASGENVFLGPGPDGLFTSSNAGHTWTNRKVPGGPVSLLSMEGTRLVAVCWHQGSYDTYLDMSKDMGTTWPGNAKIINQCAAPSSLYAVENRNFFGVDDSQNGGLWITDDDGTSWQWLTIRNTKGLGSNKVTSVVAFDNNIFVGLDLDGGSLSISEDRGRSWRVKNTIPVGSGIGVLSMSTADGKVYVGTNGGGLAISNDWWNTWDLKTIKTSGLINDTITSISVSGSTIVLGTDTGLSISADGGSNWVNKTGKDGLINDKVTAVFVQCHK